MNTVVPASARSGIDDVTRVSLSELVRFKNAVRGIKRPRGGSVSAPVHGGNLAQALGRGLDFSEVREYQPGDDVRNIDWKVTARSGRVHTKIYHEERERPFLIAVDLRTNMRFATRVAFKSVIAARLAAMLAWSAIAQRDRVGGLVFTESGLKEIKPAAGSRGVTRLLKAIVSMQDELTTATGPSTGGQTPEAHSFETLFRHLQRSAHTGSSIVLLSDFFQCDDNDSKAASQMTAHNHVVGLRIYDVLEKQLPPPAVYTITDGSARGVIDTSAKKARGTYEVMFAARSQQLSKLFAGRNGYFMECATTDSLAPVVRNILQRLPGSL